MDSTPPSACATGPLAAASCRDRAAESLVPSVGPGESGPSLPGSPVAPTGRNPTVRSDRLKLPDPAGRHLRLLPVPGLQPFLTLSPAWAGRSWDKSPGVRRVSLKHREFTPLSRSDADRPPRSSSAQVGPGPACQGLGLPWAVAGERPWAAVRKGLQRPPGKVPQARFRGASGRGSVCVSPLRPSRRGWLASFHLSDTMTLSTNRAASFWPLKTEAVSVAQASRPRGRTLSTTQFILVCPTGFAQRPRASPPTREV